MQSGQQYSPLALTFGNTFTIQDHFPQAALNPYIDGLVQERCNSSTLAMELHLSCTNPSIWTVLVCQRSVLLWIPQWPVLWLSTWQCHAGHHCNHRVDGSVQERCNSSALAMELHLSCPNPSICYRSHMKYGDDQGGWNSFGTVLWIRDRYILWLFGGRLAILLFLLIGFVAWWR